MSNVNTVTHSRLSDALERELLCRSMNSGESVSVAPFFKSIGHGLSTAVSAFANYVFAVAEALNEARAKDARFNHNAW